MKVAFVGGGAMCEAIVSGIIAAGLAPPQDISVGEPIEPRRETLESAHGVRTHAANADAIAGADVVVLAVKPQSLASALSDIAPSLEQGPIIASIVAGASMETISGGIGRRPIARVMPNTPAQIGAGMTVWTCSPEVTESQREMTRAMVSTLGDEAYVESEGLIDMATALSASGPAYVFAFIEALIDAGVAIGMPRPLAHRLTIQTVLGSAQMTRDTGTHPAQLRNLVTSPGGTTAAALMELERGGLRTAVMEAVAAAHKRAAELGGKA